MINDYVSKSKSESSIEDKKIFHEMLIITFSSNKPKYEELKGLYRQVVGLAARGAQGRGVAAVQPQDRDRYQRT